MVRIKENAQRLLHLDLMRGIFLCVIIIDHLQRFPGILDIFTGRGYLWASAAEGFFFLSGVLLGLVRGRREARMPFRDVVKKLWKRAGRLYIWNVILTLIFTALAFLFTGNSGVKPGLIGSSQIGDILREAFTLQYTYGWADFLQYYALFLFVSPLAIWLLRRDYWWAVLGASGLVWLLSGKNFYLSWQLLFFFGAIFGFYVDTIHSWYDKLSVRIRRRLVIGTISLAILTFVMSYITIIGSLYIRQSPSLWLGRYLSLNALEAFNATTSIGFDKTSLGIGRIVIFFVWFFSLYFVIKRYDLHRRLGRVGRALILFGQNSLYVYIVHSFVIFLLNLAVPMSPNILLNVVIDCGVLALLYGCLRRRLFFRIIPR